MKRFGHGESSRVAPPAESPKPSKSAKSLWIYALGCGDAFTVTNFWTNVLVNVDGREFFIDCPGYLDKMWVWHNKQMIPEVGSLGYERYKEMFLTHLHADHASGVEELAYRNVLKTGDRPKLYGPNWLLRQLWTGLLQAGIGLSMRGDRGLANMDWFFEPIPISSPHYFGDFVLYTMPAKHIPDTLIMKFDFGNYRLGIAWDTAYSPAIIEFLSDCDLVLHDVHLGDPLQSPLILTTGIHAPLADLLQAPEGFQKKTYLIHYCDNWEQYEGRVGHYRFLKLGQFLRLV